MPQDALDAGWDSDAIDVGEFPFELTPEELASACRRAYMHLVLGVDRGWGKPELARWLHGPYRRLTVRDEDYASASGPVSIRSDVAGIPDDRLVTLLENMHADVLLVMRELMTPVGLSAFTTLAFDTRLVTRDADGIVPLARSRMTLVDRVLTLVAVDALTRPEDFEHSLLVCERCHQPVFDVASRPFGVCRIHVSGVERK